MPFIKLVVDANILFSFFRPDSERKHLVEGLLISDCELVSPEFVIEELLSDKEKIKKFSGLNESEFSELFLILEDEIRVVPKSEYDKFLSDAIKLSPHIKDAPYFALALSLNSPIWSDEKAFKKQSKVKIFSTSALSKLTR